MPVFLVFNMMNKLSVSVQLLFYKIYLKNQKIYRRLFNISEAKSFSEQQIKHINDERRGKWMNSLL